MGQVVSVPVTITNNVDTPTNILGSATSGYEFGSSLGSFQMIDPGGSIAVEALFAPQVYGATNGTWTITSDDPNVPAIVVALSGAGVAPDISIAPASFDFGRIPLLSIVEDTLSITNVGTGDLTVTGLSMSGPDWDSFSFVSSNPLPYVLGPGAGASVLVRFNPGSVGPKSATLTIGNNDLTTPSVDVPLLGEGGEGELVISPQSFDFGSVWVGDSTGNWLTVYNSGIAPLTLTSMYIMGSDPSSFSFDAPPLPHRMEPGQVIYIPVTFEPTSEGTKSATLVIESDATQFPQAWRPLSGTGVAVRIVFTPSALDFASVTLGEVGMEPLTITNSGNGNLLVSAMSITGPDASFFELVNPPPLPLEVPPGGALNVTIRFTAASTGMKNAALTLLSNDPRGQVGVPLSGIGVREAPQIAGVRDVPNDQGGKVKLFWTASTLDTYPQPVVDHYWIFRSVPPQSPQGAFRQEVQARAVQGPVAAPSSKTLYETRTATGTVYWEWLTSVPAVHVFEGYSYVASTLSDSTAASNPYTWFLIMALTADDSSHWESPPDSGYSVDNLAPAAPTQFAGTYLAAGTRLRWKPNAEADLGSYRVYRGDREGFIPGPDNFVGTSAETTFVDAGTIGAYYKLSAVDVHGNESAFTSLSPSQISTVEEGSPAAFAFAPPMPNPSSGETRFGYSLAGPALVRVTIYDPLGRRVRELSRGPMPAGRHRLSWDGRDDRGNPVASGVYFLRLEAGERLAGARIVRMR